MGRRIDRFKRLPQLADDQRLARLLSGGPPTIDEVMRAAVQTSMTRSLLESLSGALILKGQPLAVQTVNAQACRWSSDIDVLVGGEIHDVISALHKKGYAMTGTIRPWAYNQVSVANPNWPITVELHWRLALPAFPCASYEDLFARRQTVDVGGLLIPTLGLSDTVIHLALHFFQHLGEIRIAADLAALLDHNDVDLKEVDRLAGALGLGPMVKLALAVADPDRATDRLVRAFADSIWELWNDNQSHDPNELADYLMQCLSTLLLSHRALQALSQSLLLGPHRLGNLLGPYFNTDD